MIDSTLDLTHLPSMPIMWHSLCPAYIPTATAQSICQVITPQCLLHIIAHIQPSNVAVSRYSQFNHGLLHNAWVHSVHNSPQITWIQTLYIHVHLLYKPWNCNTLQLALFLTNTFLCKTFLFEIVFTQTQLYKNCFTQLFLAHNCACNIYRLMRSGMAVLYFLVSVDHYSCRRNNTCFIWTHHYSISSKHYLE